MNQEPHKLNCATPQRKSAAFRGYNRQRTRQRSLISLVAGCGGLMMNVLFSLGAFTTDAAWIPLTAVFVTAILPFAGIGLALRAGRHNNPPAVLGMLASIASLVISGGLLIYFFNNLP